MRIQLGEKKIWVNFHHLYCFYIVAREGSLTKASESLGIGTSALSIQLKRFEKSVGSPLFDRSHRKLSLNERGLLVQTYAREIFRLGGELVESLNDRPSSKRIHLEIGALDTIPKHLLADIVQEALMRDDCSVTVREGKPDDLFQMLEQHSWIWSSPMFFPRVRAENFKPND
ncbi:MAG: LysR family transcriptional regulator [Proteobacteria bacterium]|nr:MAG: LysR family transcriptional regulator [Pseudomonadota bacterium]